MSLLFLLARDAFARRLDSVRTHLGAGHFLDLALRTASIIDLNALTQPQTDNVVLAPDLIHHRMRGRSGQHQGEQDQTIADFSGHPLPPRGAASQNESLWVMPRF